MAYLQDQMTISRDAMPKSSLDLAELDEPTRIFPFMIGNG